MGQFVMASWPRDFVAGRAGFSDARSIPSFFMRLRSVLGCRSRIFAAPRSPSITQSVFCRTLWMCRLSTCSSDEESPDRIVRLVMVQAQVCNFIS